MLRTVLFCSGLCCVAPLYLQFGSSEHLQERDQTVGVKPSLPTAFWSCKNGDLRRSGASAQVGPHDLSKPAWSFRETRGYGAVESTPVIDSHFNTFIATTAGGLFALQRNGSLLWSRRLHGRAMTPSLVDGVLYVATNSGKANAFDALTGREIWQKQFATEAGTDAWSMTATDGMVLVPGEGNSDGNSAVFALNASDGSTLWSFKPRNNVYNFMPAVVAHSAIFIDKSGGMYRVSLKDGVLLWQTDGYGEHSFTTGGLAVSSNGQIFATSNEDDGHGVIHSHRVEDGKLQWMQRFEMEAAAAPAMLEGEGGSSIIVGLGKNPGMGADGLVHHGKLVALDTATGVQKWSFVPPVHVGLTAAGVLKGVGTNHPEAFSIPDTWSNPAVGADGTVYIGWMGGIIFALDGRSGEEIARYKVGLSFQGEPAIAPGYLVVPSIYNVVAFDSGHVVPRNQ